VLEQSTDIVITQDHNNSTVSGDIARDPLGESSMRHRLA